MKFLLILVFLMTNSLLSEEKIECPSSIQVNKTSTAPSDWKFFSGSNSHLLARVGFYSGNPNEEASLVPDSTKTKKKESVDTWRFLSKKTHAIWIACYYIGVDSFLAKEIEDNIKVCHVNYKTNKLGTRLSVKGIFCKHY
ncbi:MAG: STY0301 family protein [Leptospiraceae bacterium]|nr:STY0301 family protein [Leptospiraceae bacterium]